MRWTTEPLAAPRGNQTHKGRNPGTWEQFDALPRIVRHVLAYAPVRLGTQRATDALHAGATAEAVAREEIRLARRFSAQEVRDLYGPDHPMFHGSPDAA